MTLVVLAEAGSSPPVKLSLDGISYVEDLLVRGKVGGTHINFTFTGGGGGKFDVPKVGEYADAIPLLGGRVLKVVTQGSYSVGQ